MICFCYHRYFRYRQMMSVNTGTRIMFLRSGPVRACFYKKECEDMSTEDLLERLICDRIEMLLNARSKEEIEEEREFYCRMEALFERLGTDWKTDMEQFWDDCIAQSARGNQYLYLAGVKDGFRIFRMLSDGD